MANEFIQYFEQNIGLDDLDFRFEGLFDPVYSYVLPGQGSIYTTGEDTLSFDSKGSSFTDNYVITGSPDSVENIVVFYAEQEERVWFPATKLEAPTVADNDLDMYRFIGTHSDVGGHWQSNPKLQNISFYAMAHKAKSEGVPMTFTPYDAAESNTLGRPNNLEEDLYWAYLFIPEGHAANKRYLATTVEKSEGIEGTFDWALSAASATWSVWDDPTLKNQLAEPTDSDNWAPGPWGIQARDDWSAAAGVNWAAIIELFWPVALAADLADGSPQPPSAHLVRKFDWEWADEDLRIKSFDKVFEELGKGDLLPSEVDLFAAFKDRRAQGNSEGLDWKD